MQFHQKDGSSGVGHTNLNPRGNIANWGTLSTVETFKIISSLEWEIMLEDSPHIQVQFSAKVVTFRRIFHFHSRPQDHKLKTNLFEQSWVEETTMAITLL
jgi:hypothetical protein